MCLPLQRKPPSDIERTLGKDYTTHENEGVNVNVSRREKLLVNLLSAHAFSSLQTVIPALQPEKRFLTSDET